MANINNIISADDNNKILSACINISNIGSKISCDTGSKKEFLPANLIPMNQNNPLANTFRISLLFDLGKFKKDKTALSEPVATPLAPSSI